MKKIAIYTTLLLVLLTAPVSAQEVTPIDPTEIPELPALIALLAGPQGWILLGGLVSMALAKWPWYNTRTSSVKQAVFLGLVSGLSVVAYLLVTYIPVGFWVASAPFWEIVAGVVITWVGGNATYLAFFKPRKE